MVQRCVVQGCSNVKDNKKGISLHTIPYHNDTRPKAIRRRRKWVSFVNTTRKKWTPSRTSVVCSVHFAPEDYDRTLSFSSQEYQKRLKKDEIGVVAVPRFHRPKIVQTPSRREGRMLLRNIQKDTSAVREDPVREEEDGEASCSHNVAVGEDDLEDVSMEMGDELENQEIDDEVIAIETAGGSSSVPDGTPSQVEQARDCANCVKLERREKKIKNQYLTYKHKYQKLKREQQKMEKQQGTRHPGSDHLAVPEPTEPVVKETEQVVMQQPERDRMEPEVVRETVANEPQEQEDEEMYPSSQDEYHTETETDETTTEEEEEEEEMVDKSLNFEGDNQNLRSQPKHIVFLSQLLLLFQFCHTCKADKPDIDARQEGTMAVVTTTCHNPSCKGKVHTWRSQPYMPGTHIAAGNFLLCFAILLAGGSASKVIQIFLHMGLGCVTLRTFFRYQRERLFPMILLHWKKYQQKMVENLKGLGEALVMAGDGRHDSMGHSAKYGAYTIFCCTVWKIIHFSLIQRNEAGSSPAMEYAGFQRCLDYLSECGIKMSTFISDRHTSIAKHMREKLKGVTHYFDLWHLKKKVQKLLSAISKESGCEVLSGWIRPCVNHLHWSATSTACGSGRIIWAKFKSFLSHITNKHADLDDPLFNKCAHGEIRHRRWLLKDSPLYEKVCAALTNSRLVSGIKQASPLSQTSCLEGFHSVLNHFCPKMIAYSFAGMFCRHVLAAIHFNSNLMRETKNKADGSEQLRIIYPKFKNGQASVRDVRINQNFDYVEEFYQTYLEGESSQLLNAASEELLAKSPPPMNSMLEKEEKEVALERREARKKMTVVNVPPTTPLSVVLAEEEASTAQSSSRSRPMCTTCKRPMKGHSSLADCPKNQAKQQTGTAEQ